jgi:hypothetical protein
MVEDDNHLLKLQVDSKDYRFDGQKGILSSSVIERDGTVYAPLEILALMKDKKREQDGNHFTIRS